MGELVFPSNIYTLGARFICAVLMHLQVEGDARQGLNMMKYSVNHRKDFRYPIRAFFIGTMQFIGGIGAELACVCFLCTQTSTILTLTKFIALAFISKVDNFYSAALTSAHPL